MTRQCQFSRLCTHALTTYSFFWRGDLAHFYFQLWWWWLWWRYAISTCARNLAVKPA